MSGAELYLRPIGFLYGETAASAVRERLALPLAGGPIAFTAVEVIEGTPGRSRRRFLTVRDIASSGEASLAPIAASIASPRETYAGIPLHQPALMGIVNVTPDSFSDGGLFDTTEAAVTQAAELAAAGAEIIDIGGESTRPGADTVEENKELQRVLPVLEKLSGLKAVLSIDTRKAGVARAAAEAGAKIFNDVSALTYDKDSLAAAAETKLCVVLMHAKGEPPTMQNDPRYDDVVHEVYDYLEERIEAVERAGIPRARIAADPGIGFGKTMVHNLALLSHLSLFHGLGVPLLVGASRKRFISGVSGGESPRAREPGSYAVALAAAAQGVQILRVHDVAGTRQALAVWQASLTGEGT